MQAKNGKKLVIHPTNSLILYAAMQTGIYKTTDGGTVWTKIKSGNFHDLELKPGTPSTIFIAGDGVIFTSTNNGSSWQQLTSGLPVSGDRVALAVTAANPNCVYALFGKSNSAGTYVGLYRSTNGTTFSPRSTTPNILGWDKNGSGEGDQGWYDLTLTVQPGNAEVVYTGGVDCWKSSNGGQTFSNVAHWFEPDGQSGNYVHADIHHLEFAGNILLCASDGGVYKTLNYGTEWVNITNGIQITNMYRMGSDPNLSDKVVCGTQDNGMNYITANKHYHWAGGDGMEGFATPLSSNTLYGTCGGDLLKSTDNGTNTFSVRPPHSLVPDGQGNWVTPFLHDPVNAAILYAGYHDVVKSPNEGGTWTNISNGQLGTGNCDHVTVSPANTQYIYASKGNELYMTQNGGTLWTSLNSSLTTGYIKRLEAHPFAANTVYVVAEKGVFKLVTGTTPVWNPIALTSLPNVSYNCIVQDKLSSSNGLYLGTDLGVFYKDDGMTEWIPFNKGLPELIFTDIEIHYLTSTVRIGTNGRGAWKSPLHNETGIDVSITSPARNADFFEGANYTIQAAATTASGTISKVEFYSNGIKLGEDLVSPYTYSVTNAAAGDYILNAVAYNSGGSSLVSGEVRISVFKLRNPENPVSTVAGVNYNYYQGAWNETPDFNLMTPVASGTVSTFDITPRLQNDDFGFVFTGFINIPSDGVYTFYTNSDDGSNLYIGSDYVVNNDGLHGSQEVYQKVGLKAGKHAITVNYLERGGDEVLQVLYSGPGITKQVIPANVLFRSSGGNVAPSVSITSPAGGTSYTAPASITINASASDVDGTVSKVEFYQGTTKLGEDLVSPYTYTWSNVAAGSYSLTAKAFDNATASTTSSAVSVTVTTVQSGDIFGPACASGGQTFTLELNPTLRTNATSYSWWANTSVSSINPVLGEPYKANVVLNSTFTGGQMCVGVNYSGAPYYSQYCKTIAVCGSPRLSSSDKTSYIIAPNPAEHTFSIQSEKEISSIKVMNMKGQEVYKADDLILDAPHEFGSTLPFGLYMVYIQFTDGSEEVLKILKTR